LFIHVAFQYVFFINVSYYKECCQGFGDRTVRDTDSNLDRGNIFHNQFFISSFQDVSSIKLTIWLEELLMLFQIDCVESPKIIGAQSYFWDNFEIKIYIKYIPICIGRYDVSI